MEMQNKGMTVLCEKGKIPQFINLSKADVYSARNEKLILIGKCFDDSYYRMSSEDIYLLIKNNRFCESEYNGIYSIIYFDGNETIYFQNDRMNLSRLYYFWNENLLIISDKVSSIVQYVKEKLTIDYFAWAEFFCFYYVLGNRTFFHECKSLFFGEHIHINLNHWEISSDFNYDLLQIPVNNNLKYQDAVVKAAELIQKSIDIIFTKTEGKKKVITLSGGYDSRTIAAASAKINKKDICTYTAYIDSGNDKEERFAKMVADYLKIENYFIDLDENYYLTQLQEYIKDVEYFSIMHLPFWNFYKKLYKEEKSIILDGLGGDLLFRGMSLPNTKDYEVGSEEYLEECFKKMKLGHYEEFASIITKKGIPNMAKRGMAEELKRCNYNLRFFVLANRISKLIGIAIDKINEKFDVMMPFMNRELLNWAFSIPDKFLFDTNFYPDIMKKIDSGVAELPSTNKLNGSRFETRKIYRISNEITEFYKKIFDHRFSEVNRMYDPILIYRTLNKRTEDNTLGTYRSLELVLFYQLWFDEYKNKLYLEEDIFDYLKNKITGDIKNNVITAVLSTGERKELMGKWLEFYKEHEPSNMKEKMKIICTMDVEAFQEKDARSAHTSNKDYLQRLIYGYEKENEMRGGVD